MLIYRSFYEAIKELKKEDQADVWAAVHEYGLNRNEIDLKGISKTIFTLIKPQLEANLKRFENGSKAKRKQSKSKTKANNNNNNNNNNNVNNISIVDKQKNFLNKLKVYQNDFDKDLLNNFYLYWSEANEKTKKLRCELEKTFEIKRRLQTWQRRQKELNPQSDNKAANSHIENLKKQL